MDRETYEKYETLVKCFLDGTISKSTYFGFDIRVTKQDGRIIFYAIKGEKRFMNGINPCHMRLKDVVTVFYNIIFCINKYIQREINDCLWESIKD